MANVVSHRPHLESRHMSRASTSAVSRNCVIMFCMNRSDPKQPELTSKQQRALDAHGGIVEGDSFVLMHKDVILDFFGYGSPQDLLRELQPAVYIGTR